jgi:hypothetical protein
LNQSLTQKTAGARHECIHGDCAFEPFSVAIQLPPEEKTRVSPRRIKVLLAKKIGFDLFSEGKNEPRRSKRCFSAETIATTPSGFRAQSP